MRFQKLTALFLLSTALLGCGEDVAKNKSNRPVPRERTNQGVEGASVLVSSQIHRSRGFDVLSYTDEINFTLNNTLSTAYRQIPDMLLDDEGRHNGNVLTVSGLIRPGVVCGVGGTFAGINGRISDCSRKNGTKALWNGALNGAAGESTWKLVALSEDKREIWQDLRTGMVWSDIVATANWCKASGNKQTTGINCSVVGEEQSLCVGADIEGLGANVRWRLPTRGDFLQADLDGIRFVMKPGSSTGSWTATLVAASEDRLSGWVYNFIDGTLSAQELTTDRHVRCIGVPIQ